MSSSNSADGVDGRQRPPHTADNAVLDTLLAWRDQLETLTDLSKDAAGLTLNLGNAHPGGLAQLYAEHPTRLSNLVREPREQEAAQIRARRLMAYGAKLKAIHGQCAIHLALGKVTWTEPVAQAQTEAQSDAVRDEHFVSCALMRPVELAEDSEGNITLTLKPGTHMGPTLVQALSARGVNTDPNYVFASALTSHGFAPSRALSAIKEAGRVLNHFDVKDVLEVGIFIHPARVLLSDYGQMSALLAHPLVRAGAGDQAAASLTKRALPEANPNDRDPWKELGVGDLTPSQQDIVEAAAGGTSLVVDAPQDSSDIAVLTAIAVECATRGKRVVHVAGSVARIDAVENYLRELSLPEIAAHVGIAAPHRLTNRSDLALTVERALDDTSSVVDPSETTTMRTRLVEVREALSSYTTSLHRPFGRFGVSAFDALQALTDLTNARPSPRTRVRLKEDVLAAIAQDQGEQARTLLHRAHELGIFSAQADRSGWAGAVINSAEQVPRVMEHVHQLSDELLPKMRVQMAAIAGETGLKVATSLEEWEKQLRMLEGVREVLDVFKPAIFERSAADMVIATASKQWRRDHGITMKRSQRNRLVKQAQDFLLPGRHVDDLHQELLLVQDKRDAWRRQCDSDGWPVLPARMDQAIATAQQVRRNADRLSPMLSTSHHDLTRMDVNAVADLLERLAADSVGARKLPQRVAVLKEITALGLDQLSADFKARHVSKSMIDAEVDLAWWASLLSIMLAAQPELGGLDPANLESLLEEGRNLDTMQVASLVPQAIDQIRRQRRQILATQPEGAERLRLALETGSEDAQLLQDNPMAWVLVPILHTVATAVPSLFGPLRRHTDAPIDVLILDGVDQLSMGELAPVIARAQQVILFADVDGAHREQRASSILLKALPVCHLKPNPGHLNDSVARLLARHELAVGGIPTPLGVSTQPVSALWSNGQGMPAPGTGAVESSQGEVADVVETVIQHALTHADQSLSVIALNDLHAQRIRQALSRQIENRPELVSFFDRSKPEPFVVVGPLHARQASRDHVIVTVGYAKTPHGRVIHDFGQISTSAGARIMIQVLQAIRGDLTVVSSMRPEELDRTRLNFEGSTMLVELLDIAEGAQPLVTDEVMWPVQEQEPDRLLVDLAERLYSMGLEVIPNLGSADGMRIPLAIGHPEVPGRLLLAVLTDDDAYIRQPSLRVRDRVWPAQLRQQGWQVRTELSMAVFIDPERAAQTIVDQLLDAVDDINGPLREAQTMLEADAGQKAVVSAQTQPARLAGLPSLGEQVTEEDLVSVDASGDVETNATQSAGNAGKTPTRSDTDSAANADASDADKAEQVSTVSDSAEVSQMSDSDRARQRRDNLETGMMDLRSLQHKLETLEENDKPPRGPRPGIAKGLPLAAYGDDQLDEMAQWIRSDGVDRSVDEVAEELRQAIGLRRRGLQTDAVLRNVARRTAPVHNDESTQAKAQINEHCGVQADAEHE